ncbi:MAG: CdaR family protein, partial [Pyrinomonadaceae bacterium]
YEDRTLLLLAVLITLGLWLAVTSQRTPTTARLRNVPLIFAHSPEMEISNDPREQVEVTLRGSRRALDALKSGGLVVTFDAGGFQPGDRMVRLTPQNVELGLPDEVSADGVTVERIEPSTIPLRLERRVEREVEVKPRLEGKVAAGYEIVEIQAAPASIRVRGPENRVNSLTHALTETISIEDKTQSFSVEHAAIDIPDQKLVPSDAVVDVRVKIEEERIERTLAGVAVRPADARAGEARPASATVTVRGPRSLVGQLRPEDLTLVLDEFDGVLKPRLLPPPDLQGRIELLSTAPAEFSLTK